MRDLDARFSPWADWLVAYGNYYGLGVRVTSTRRSISRQAQLYQDWIAGRSPYPAAYPGTSKHERGLAFDISTSHPDALLVLGRIWESAGGRWGGRFSARDPIHFESP